MNAPKHRYLVLVQSYYVDMREWLTVQFRKIASADDATELEKIVRDEGRLLFFHDLGEVEMPEDDWIDLEWEGIER